MKKSGHVIALSGVLTHDQVFELSLHHHNGVHTVSHFPDWGTRLVGVQNSHSITMLNYKIS